MGHRTVLLPVFLVPKSQKKMHWLWDKVARSSHSSVQVCCCLQDPLLHQRAIQTAIMVPLFLLSLANKSYSLAFSCRSKLESFDLLETTQIILLPVVLCGLLHAVLHTELQPGKRGECWNEKQEQAQEPSTAPQLNEQWSRISVANAKVLRLCIVHISHMLLLCSSGHTTEQFAHTGFTEARHQYPLQDSPPADVGERSYSFLLEI